MDLTTLRETLTAYSVDLRVSALALSLLLVLTTIAVTWHSSKESPVPYTVEIPAELKTGFSGYQQPNHEPELRNGKIYPRCPADGRSLSIEPITPATPQDIDSAIAHAQEAQKKWAKTSFSQRRQFLNTVLKYILDNQEPIVAACCLDSGKTKIDACFGEVLVSVEKLQWTVKHGEKALTAEQRPTNILMSYKKNTVIYEPMGVTAACFSWNYPFHFVISNVTSALFAGNAVILKPSEQTCWSSRYFLSIVRRALEVCGHDPELIQNVICLPDSAEYLTSHPDIDHITFIGSKAVAYDVCRSAAKALTPVCVELGGKDAAILLDDAKTVKALDDITAIIMRGVFQSAGQNCIGIERVIALPKVHDLILSRVTPLIKKLRLGSVTMETNPPDMGSMISSTSFNRLESLIKSAVSQGAILHCGGTRFSHPRYPHGRYFTPTLLSNVTPNMDIAQTELFAPIFLLMRASSAAEAISIANGTSYALGASIFGDPTSHDTKMCIRSIRSGMVSVNDFGVYYACGMPFGGAKGSGYGRFSGAEGLRSLCNLKSICEDHPWAEFLGIRTRIPAVLQYPVDGLLGWQACMGVVETGYSLTWPDMLRGITRLLRAVFGKKKSTSSLYLNGSADGEQVL